MTQAFITPDGRIGVRQADHERLTYLMFADRSGAWLDRATLTPCAPPAWAAPKRHPVVSALRWGAVGLAGLLVYACAADQLARSGLEGYDTRPPAAEVPRPILREDTREVILEAARAAARLSEAAAERASDPSEPDSAP